METNEDGKISLFFMPFVFLILKFGVELPIFESGKIDVTIIYLTVLKRNGNALFLKDRLTSKTASKRNFLPKSFKSDVIPFINWRSHQVKIYNLCCKPEAGTTY